MSNDSSSSQSSGQANLTGILASLQQGVVALNNLIQIVSSIAPSS